MMNLESGTYPRMDDFFKIQLITTDERGITLIEMLYIEHMKRERTVLVTSCRKKFCLISFTLETKITKLSGKKTIFIE